MELPNLIISVPTNISEFAEAKGTDFNQFFCRCIDRIQSDEVMEVRANGKYIRAALIKARKALANKIALNPKDCSRSILEEVKTLTPEEIEGLLENAMKEYPLWYKTLAPFLTWFMNSVSFTLIDDMFEVDSEAFFQADKKQFNQVLQLVYLVGLTIPEQVEQGSRVRTFLSEK